MRTHGWLGVGWMLACAVAGCWRDPDAIEARFTAAQHVDASADAIACDDGDPCTLDSPGQWNTACTHLALTGVDCGDAAPCLVKPICEQGVCAGPDRYWSKTFQITGRSTEFTAVDVDQTGQLVVFGWAETTQSLRAVKQPFLLSLTDDGSDPGGGDLAPTWLKDDAWNHHEITDASALVGNQGSTRWLTVGFQTDVTNGRQKAWSAVVDSHDGITTEESPPLEGHHLWQRVARAEDGSFLAVGRQQPEAPSNRVPKPLTGRFDKFGIPTWSQVLLPDGPLHDGHLMAVAAVPGKKASWLAVGYTAEPTMDGEPREGWVVEVAGPGAEVVWQATYAPPKDQPIWIGRFEQVAVVSDQEAIVAGSLWNVGGYLRPTFVPWGGAGSDVWVVKIHLGTGAVLWERRWRWGGLLAPIVWNPLLQRIEMGDAGDPPTKAPGLLRYADSMGNLFPATSAPLHVAHRGGMRRLADGRVVWVGGYGGLGVAQVVSPWGAGSCAQTGNCQNIALGACDDGESCTFDRCDPAAGCQHVPLDPGSVCQEGFCKEGTCVP